MKRYRNRDLGECVRVIISKSIIFLLLGFTIFVSLENILVNLLDIKHEGIKSGIVNKTEYVGRSRKTNQNYYVRDDKKILLGSHNLRDDYRLLEGDTILYRRTDFRTGIKALFQNGEKIENWYGFWDILCPLFLITIILGFLYLPDKTELYKKQHNEKLLRDFYRK